MAWRRLARVVQLLIVARGWEREIRGYVQGLALLQKAVSIVRVCWQVYCAVFSGVYWEEEERLPRSGIACTSLLYVA